MWKRGAGARLRLMLLRLRLRLLLLLLLLPLLPLLLLLLPPPPLQRCQLLFQELLLPGLNRSARRLITYGVAKRGS